MLTAWRRLMLVMLVSALLFNLAKAIVDGGQARWLMVAIIALLLAANLRRRPRAGS